MVMGRPSKLNDELKDKIFECLIVKDLTIKQAAKECGVSEKTIYQWVKDTENFGKFLARVRETKAHKLINRCEAITRELEAIDPAKEDKDSAKIEVNIKRAAFDMYLRLAGKYNRQAYGDKVDTDITSKGNEVSGNIIINTNLKKQGE